MCTTQNVLPIYTDLGCRRFWVVFASDIHEGTLYAGSSGVILAWVTDSSGLCSLMISCGIAMYAPGNVCHRLYKGIDVTKQYFSPVYCHNKYNIDPELINMGNIDFIKPSASPWDMLHGKP